MRGRSKAALVLMQAEREEVKALTLQRKTAQAWARRAHRAGLCRRAGQQNGCDAPAFHAADRGQVARPVRRTSFNGLLDAPRSGAPRTIDEACANAVIAKMLESVLRGAAHWSTRHHGQRDEALAGSRPVHLAFRLAAASP